MHWVYIRLIMIMARKYDNTAPEPCVGAVCCVPRPNLSPFPSTRPNVFIWQIFQLLKSQTSEMSVWHAPGKMGRRRWAYWM